MQTVIRLILQTFMAGKRYARNGLLYEAAYHYGQTLAMIKVVYLLHGEEVLKLSHHDQQKLAELHASMETLAMSLRISAGNGRHKMGSAESEAKESLLRVIEMLEEDLRLLG